MKFILSFFVLIVTTQVAFSQAKSVLDKTIFVDYGERFHADAYVVPTASPDTARIAVFFRLANDFLNFTKVNDPNDVRGNYRADMAVGIELRDTLGVIRKRVRWEGVAYTNEFDQTNSKNDFHYGWQAIDVTAGTYSISLEILNQKESNQKKISIPMVSFIPRRALRLLTAPMFVEPIAKDGRELLRPYVFSGNVAFGSRDARALVLLSDKESVDYDYVITQLPWDSRDIRWWRVSDVRGVARSSTSRFPRMSVLATTDAPYLEIEEELVNTRPLATVEIPVPVTAMVPGAYELALIRAGTRDTIRSTFRVLWEMMPLSLRNLDYAIRSMSYLLNEDRLDSIDGGSDAERREQLMNWWRQEDPTQTTTYNERMAEFFHRIDQAFFAFSTIQEPDGSRSERGRVYALYGPPQDISKKLSPGEVPLEIWTYTNRVKKVITFLIDDKGIFKIKSVEPVP